MNDNLKEANRGEAMTPTPEHIVRAQEHQRRLREASSRMARSIRAVGDLFGRELADHLTLKHEDLTENAGEAIYHLEKRIEEIEEREQQTVRALTALAGEARNRARTHADYARQAVAELERRSRRSGRPLPDFVAEFHHWCSIENGPF